MSNAEFGDENISLPTQEELLKIEQLIIENYENWSGRENTAKELETIDRKYEKIISDVNINPYKTLTFSELMLYTGTYFYNSKNLQYN